MRNSWSDKGTLTLLLLFGITFCMCISANEAHAVGEALCPAGAKVSGRPPPKGHRIVCEKPSQRKKGQFLRHGRYMEWHPNDKLAAEGEFWNDMKDGKWKEYHSNGQISMDYEYKQGIKHGKWTEWHRNGQLKLQCEYSNGKKNGREIEWYKEGMKRFEGEYIMGEQQGKWVTWSKDGTIKSVVFYDKGKIIEKDVDF